MFGDNDLYRGQLLGGIARNTEIWYLTQSLFHHPYYTFYLTGSRFFGTDTEESDFDFFVEGDERGWYLDGFLQSLKFTKVDTSPYKTDVSCVAIYQHSSGIHIQVVDNVERRKTVRDLIQKYKLYCWGDFKINFFASQLWNALNEALIKKEK